MHDGNLFERRSGVVVYAKRGVVENTVTTKVGKKNSKERMTKGVSAIINNQLRNMRQRLVCSPQKWMKYG